MAEIIDILFVLWCILAAGVFILGQIFDKQLQQKRTGSGQQVRGHLARTNLDDYGDEYSRHGSSCYFNYNQSSYRDGDQGRYESAPRSACNSNQQQFSSPSCHTNAHLSSTLNIDHINTTDYTASGYGHTQAGAPYAAPSPLDAANYYDRFSGEAGASYSPCINLLDGGPSHLFDQTAGSIPTATGFNGDCVEWVNSILYLFYTQPQKYGPIISENVNRSLNEKLANLISSSSGHSNLLGEFEGINSESSSRPELTNVRTECESDKSISVTCKIYNKRLSLNLAVSRLLDRATSSAIGLGDNQVARYELVLENLEGKLKSMAMLGDKLIVIQFIEKPDTKILLRPILAVPTSDAYGLGGGGERGRERVELIAEDLLVQMILQTLTQVVVDLYFGDDVDFPQFKHSQHQSAYSNYKHKINNIFKGSANELKRSLKNDFFGTLSHLADPPPAKERKVFVKIIRANNINYNQNVTCLMELDAPKQQAISSTKHGSSPFWDEHFLFTVNDKSSELVFELWDSLNLAAVEQVDNTSTPSSTLKRQHKGQSQAVGQSSSNNNSGGGGSNPTKSTRWQRAELTAGAAKFLGMARVTVDELRQTPVQKVSLVLQPTAGHPNDLSHSVGGELQLELLYLEHSNFGGTSAGSTRSPAPPSHSLHKSNSLSSLAYHQGDIVSIDRKLTPSGFVITTTTITKQPPAAKTTSQQASQKLDQLLVRSQSPAGSSSVATEHSFDELNLDAISGSAMSATNEARQASTAQADRRSEGTGAGSSIGPGRLSRSRSRSRTFLRALKSRLSFSRARARSVGEPSGRADSSQSSARLEAEYDARSRASSVASAAGPDGSGRAKSVPASRDTTDVPTIVINRGRLSDTASAYAFTRPKSQLVIEVLEPTLREDGNGNHKTKGIYRYYAIPEDSMKPNRIRKWRSRGTKLHMLNEHQFVAEHLELADTCHICGRIFARRPGKQGYKCRNCHFLAHKKCHLMVDHICPYAARDLTLEFIDAEPPTRLADELARAQGQHQSGSGGGGRELALGNMSKSRDDPYQARQMAPGRAAATSRGGRSSMRMTAKSISMEVEDSL